MSDYIIKVENLSKSYQIKHQNAERYTALRDVITNNVKHMGSRLLGRSNGHGPTQETFWALKDVSFEVQPGERVGIIGRNGAGKSTLLKILSRITEPTSGRVRLRGRVASLLEVGTGFHPELTGRENIYLNGAILGMTRQEIKRKFDEIVAFAEVEQFLDMPVKRYSSGMYVRLAFAVAAHLEPEILVVDEVLAVGDAEFQKKCLGKMEEVTQSEGRTILFVSHNLSAVNHLCNQGVYLESGNIHTFGNIINVIDAYQKTYTEDEDKTIGINDVSQGEAKFVQWQVDDSSSDLKHGCYSRDLCRFTFTLVTKRYLSQVFIGFAMWDQEGDLILSATSRDNNGQYTDFGEGIHEISIDVRLPLKAGNYQLDVSLNSLNEGLLSLWKATPNLNILPRLNTSLPEKWHGILNEEINFTFSKNMLMQENENLLLER